VMNGGGAMDVSEPVLVKKETLKDIQAGKSSLSGKFRWIKTNEVQISNR